MLCTALQHGEDRIDTNRQDRKRNPLGLFMSLPTKIIVLLIVAFIAVSSPIFSKEPDIDNLLELDSYYSRKSQREYTTIYLRKNSPCIFFKEKNITSTICGSKEILFSDPELYIVPGSLRADIGDGTFEYLYKKTLYFCTVNRKSLYATCKKR